MDLTTRRSAALTAAAEDPAGNAAAKDKARIRLR
jgi:hypothetical protein